MYSGRRDNHKGHGRSLAKPGTLSESLWTVSLLISFRFLSVMFSPDTAYHSFKSLSFHGDLACLLASSRLLVCILALALMSNIGISPSSDYAENASTAIVNDVMSSGAALKNTVD